MIKKIFPVLCTIAILVSGCSGIGNIIKSTGTPGSITPEATGVVYPPPGVEETTAPIASPSPGPYVPPQQPVTSNTRFPPVGNGTSSGSSLNPLPNEDKLTRGKVTIESSELLSLETYPVQVLLHVKGNLPTPCHLLRVSVEKPDNENRIKVKIYSVYDPGEVCIQMIKPFDTSIPLGSYQSGTYTVYINGEKVAKFDI